jgi:hypothetical protein
MTTNNINNETVIADEYYTTLCATFGEEYVIEMLAAAKKKKEEEAKKAERAKARKEKALAKGVALNTERAKSSKQLIAGMKKGAAIADADLVIKTANALCAVREKFETETLARSNKELYGILADVYRLFMQAVSKKCLKETAKSMRDNLKKRGIRVQNNTNALTVFVRYVFNNDRKRAYNYASTLQAALQANVEADGLAEFIESKNGVEECKREFRKSDETKSKEAQLTAAAACVIDELGNMEAQQVVKLADARVELAEGTKFVFVVARENADGMLELLQVVNKTTVAMQNAAVKELAKRYVETQATAKKVAAKALKKAGTVKVTTAKAAAKLTMRELEGA